MAAVSYSVIVGGNLEQVVAGTQAPSAGQVEIRIDQTSTTITDGATTRMARKAEVQQAINLLTQYLMRDTGVIE